ncbi:hypothetical protein JCM30760_05440 [Thiomicrorhabdus hydrogeniphila]
MHFFKLFLIAITTLFLFGCGKSSSVKNDNNLLYEERYLEAIQNNDLDSLKEMESRGYISTRMVRKNESRYPVHYAITNKKTSLISFFKGAGYDLDDIDSNNVTPLMLAVKNGELASVKELIRLGADINVINIDGLVALSFLTEYHDVDFAKFLIKAGANLELTNDNGYILLQQFAYMPKLKQLVQEEISKRIQLAYEKGTLAKSDYEYKIAVLNQNLGNHQVAIKHFRSAAALQSIKATIELGIIYFEGKFVERNYTKAMKFYNKAASMDDLTAMFLIGDMYHRGVGVSQNSAVAYRWFKKAADRGHSLSQNNVGAMYDKGDGVKQNYDEAFKWYKKAAEQGVVFAEASLGVLYDKGRGVEKNAKKSFEWYKKAAKHNEICSQARLGDLYKHGYGVTRNYSLAVRWYIATIENPDRTSDDNVCFSNALNNLGVIYYNGQGGVQRDKTKGLSLFKRACQWGNENGCKNYKGY